jgi:iron complex transport system ATP-binding protein
VQLDTIRVAYLQQPVLRDVDLGIRSGEFFAIIGPNGSGKTTLLKTMAGMIHPQRGSIRIMERPLEEYSRRSLARTLAMVPQSPELEFSFTVWEVILMGRSPHLGLLGLEGDRDFDIARRAMRSMRVGHLSGRRMHQLSGGEKQRVLIARALCQEPAIMLLDEPTSSLDLSHQVQVMDLLEELKNKQGITVVMVAHDINLAALYADRLLLLHEGSALCQGPPAEVLTFDRLERAFGCVLLVDASSLDGLPRVSVIPGRYLDRDLVHSFRRDETGTDQLAQDPPRKKNGR